MTKLEMILSSIARKNIFEYVFIDKDLKIVNTSLGISKYLNQHPVIGESILIHMPELYECGENIESIFKIKDEVCNFKLIHKNKFYVNISIEYYNENMALVLLQNVTETTKAKQKILQHSNEMGLLYSVLQQIIDRQNAFIFLSNNQNSIEFANEKFINYFNIKDIDALNHTKIEPYTYYDIPIKSYNELYMHVNNVEEQIKIGDDIFIVKATRIESIYKLFTLTKVTNFLEPKQLPKKEEVDIDTLTGIYRKNFFDMTMKKALKDNIKFALVILDIDDFKKINEYHGYQVGNNILQVFTKVIKEHLEVDDIIARWSENTFLLMLKGEDKDALKIRIKQLHYIIENYDFLDIKQLTSSFGVSFVTKKDDIDNLCYRANKALYKAKRKGKNKIIFKKYKE